MGSEQRGRNNPSREFFCLRLRQIIQAFLGKVKNTTKKQQIADSIKMQKEKMEM